MGIIVNRDDFIGKFGISQKKPMLNGTDVIGALDSFINDNEEELLIELFGIEMYNDFKVTPNDPIYNPILNPLTGYNGKYSQGLKNMLIIFIYYRYQRLDYVNTVSGQKKTKGETSKDYPASSSLVNLTSYNKAVNAYNVISEYLGNNTNTFVKYDPLVSKKRIMTL